MSSNSPASINHRFQEQLKAMSRYIQQARDHSLKSEFVPNRVHLFRHFVLCTREFLSFVKVYLESKGIAADNLSERELIHALEKSGALSHDDSRTLINISDDSFKADDEPSEGEAEKLVKHILEYFQLMLDLGKKMASEMDISEKDEPKIDDHNLI